MTHLTEVVYRALGDLKAQIAKENDAARLQGLVIEINALLDLIEIQLTKIERRQGSAKD
jgi:hypothetical protein